MKEQLRGSHEPACMTRAGCAGGVVRIEPDRDHDRLDHRVRELRIRLLVRVWCLYGNGATPCRGDGTNTTPVFFSAGDATSAYSARVTGGIPVTAGT
jgi:hypothetical protein